APWCHSNEEASARSWYGPTIGTEASRRRCIDRWKLTSESHYAQAGCGAKPGDAIDLPKNYAILVRGKLRAALAKRRPDLVLPEAAWRKPWVAHCTSWGEGADAVLAYLARYVHRVAITNNRIIGVDDAGVAVPHKERESGRWRTTHLAGP